MRRGREALPEVLQAVDAAGVYTLVDINNSYVYEVVYMYTCTFIA